jgi:hypothetical protein
MVNMVLAPTAVTSNVSLSTGAGAILGATNVKLLSGPTRVDITSLGDDAVKRYPTIKDWSLTFDVVYDHNDTGQADIITKTYTPASATWTIGLSGGHTLAGIGYIESLNYSFDPKEVIRVSVTVKGSGVMAYA